MTVLESPSQVQPEAHGQVEWPETLPNPWQPVDELPWDRWCGPWRDEDREPDPLGSWFFCAGMILWEIQDGLHPPYDAVLYMPEDEWLDLILEWLMGADPGKPPPLHHRRRLAAWKRRQAGVNCYIAAMLARKSRLMLDAWAGSGAVGMVS